MSKRPDLTPLDSSALKGMHYDPATSKLTVEFTGGGVYEYADVPMERAEALRENASPGSYFARKIASLYPGSKIA